MDRIGGGDSGGTLASSAARTKDGWNSQRTWKAREDCLSRRTAAIPALKHSHSFRFCRIKVNLGEEK